MGRNQLETEKKQYPGSHVKKAARSLNRMRMKGLLIACGSIWSLVTRTVW